MAKQPRHIITVQETPISITEDDFISLTDLAKRNSEEPDEVVKNWMRLKQLEDKNWSLRRELAKLNYPLHTAAVRRLREAAAPPESKPNQLPESPIGN